MSAALRIVCCYVPGQLRDETVDALDEHAGHCDVRMIELPAGDDYAYGRELAEQWGDALDFQRLAIVEPDIVVRDDVIDAFETHPAGYVCFPYAWTTDVGPALGCTRFSMSFMDRYEDLIDEAVATGVGWQQLDVVIMRHILARKHGEQPTVLLPPVEHLNEAKRLLSDASPVPLMEVPHW